MFGLEFKLNKKRNYDKVFSSDEGQAVLQDIYKFCGAGQELKCTNDNDTNYNLGKYRVAQYITRLLNLKDKDIEKIYLQQKEQQKPYSNMY